MTAAPDRLDDPAPVRRHEDAFAAQIDAARLADSGIPARVIEPRGPSGFGGPGLAVVMVPATRVAEAIAVLEQPASGDADAAPDTAAPDAAAADPAAGPAPDEPPFSAAPMPPLARLGLWLAAAAVLLGILGALVTLFTGR